MKTIWRPVKFKMFKDGTFLYECAMKPKKYCNDCGYKRGQYTYKRAGELKSEIFCSAPIRADVKLPKNYIILEKKGGD